MICLYVAKMNGGEYRYTSPTMSLPGHVMCDSCGKQVTYRTAENSTNWDRIPDSKMVGRWGVSSGAWYCKISGECMYAHTERKIDSERRYVLERWVGYSLGL